MSTAATKPHVVRLSELAPDERRLVLALIEAKRAAERKAAAS